jgi:hypothetical protein
VRKQARILAWAAGMFAFLAVGAVASITVQSVGGASVVALICVVAFAVWWFLPESVPPKEVSTTMILTIDLYGLVLALFVPQILLPDHLEHLTPAIVAVSCAITASSLARISIERKL